MEIKNTDELGTVIEANDLHVPLEEASSGLTSMSVQEYAKANGLQPQLIYYYIRRGRIRLHPCGSCGQKVIDVIDANEVFIKDHKK